MLHVYLRLYLCRNYFCYYISGSTYVPDARLSNSCFSQVNILNGLPPRSRSDIYITARHRDDAFLERVITHQSNSSQALEEEFNINYDRPSGRKTVKRPAKGDINTQATKRPVRAEQPQGIPYERLFNVTEAKKQALEKMNNGTSTGAYGVGQPSSYSVQSQVKVNKDQKQDHIQTNNQAAPKSFGQSSGIHAHDQTNTIETQKQAQEQLFNDSVCLNDSLGQSPEIFAQSWVDFNDVQLQGPSDASNLYRYQPLIPTINMVNPGFCQNGSYNAQPDTPLGMDPIPKMSDMKKTRSPTDLQNSVDKCLAKLNKEYAKKANRKRKRSIDWKNFNDVTIENDNDFYRYGPKRQRRDSDSNSTVSLDEPVKMDVTPPPPPPFKYPVADAATRRYFEKVIALRDGRPPISSESNTKKKKNTRSRRPSTRRN